jgi:hypothetical protein
MPYIMNKKKKSLTRRKKTWKLDHPNTGIYVNAKHEHENKQCYLDS